MFNDFKRNLKDDLENILEENEKYLLEESDFINYFIELSNNSDIDNLINWSVGIHRLDPLTLSNTKYIGISEHLDDYIIARVLYWNYIDGASSKQINDDIVLHFECNDLDTGFPIYSKEYEITEEYIGEEW